MGISFPKRFVRSALGPKLVDDIAVERPISEVGAAAFNPAFWAESGMNLVVPRAQFVASWNGSAFVISHQEEAWNPEHDQAHPTPARSATGRYSYTFASTYLDEDGVAQPTIIAGCRATCHADAIALLGAGIMPEAFAWIDSTNPLVVQVQVGSRVLSTGVHTARDYPFWLTVL
jgi:hypothetical protein